MKYGYLRIAFSAVCGIICVLLIALWVRSYQRRDGGHRLFVTQNGTQEVQITSSRGKLRLDLFYVPFIRMPEMTPIPEMQLTPIPSLTRPSPKLSYALFGFGVYTSTTNNYIGVLTPFWFLVLITAAPAGAPWIHQIKWRFSLRTLLIAMTLIAAGLGVIVAWSR